MLTVLNTINRIMLQALTNLSIHEKSMKNASLSKY